MIPLLFYLGSHTYKQWMKYKSNRSNLFKVLFTLNKLSNAMVIIALSTSLLLYLSISLQ